jgi:hypothetical protein
MPSFSAERFSSFILPHPPINFTGTHHHLGVLLKASSHLDHSSLASQCIDDPIQLHLGFKPW